jgi:small neutral amino acid transporter SnatA (MarC family)
MATNLLVFMIFEKFFSYSAATFLALLPIANPYYLGCIVGIVGLGITLYLCLVLGDRLLDALGKIEIGALNRVLGFFILAIAVQFIADGSFDIIQENMPELWQQLDKKVSNICF